MTAQPAAADHHDHRRRIDREDGSATEIRRSQIAALQPAVSALSGVLTADGPARHRTHRKETEMLDRHEEIMKTLRATPVVLRALTDGIDDATLRRRPGAGEWAIIEVVAHLADTEERALARVRQMTGQDDPYLDSFDQEALASQGRYFERDLAGELGRLERLRAEHLAELGRLGGPGWERTGRHGQHGQMSVELYETHVAAEEVDHLAQIARLR